MRRPWEKSRSMAAFVDKVELSLCLEDRFSCPKAPPNALGGVPDHSREHPRIPSGTPHRPHRAEVAPEPVGPRVSSLPIDVLGPTPAHPPPSPYTNPSSTSSFTLPLEHRPPRLARVGGLGHLYFEALDSLSSFLGLTWLHILAVATVARRLSLRFECF